VRLSSVLCALSLVFPLHHYTTSPTIVQADIDGMPKIGACPLFYYFNFTAAPVTSKIVNASKANDL
jgi:hypothetical protein